MKLKLKYRFKDRIQRGLKPKLQFCKNPRFLVAIALFSLSLILTVGPLKILFDRAFLLQVLSDPCCQAIIYIFLIILFTIVGIPGTILVITGGIVFGLFWGTIWSVLGATLGALAAFLTSRYLFRECTENRFTKNKMLAKFKQAVIDRPFAFILIIRLIPVSPFNLENYLFALTPVNWFPYTLATFLGIIPGTLLYTWLGITGRDALNGGARLPFLLALIFLLLLSIIPIYFNKKQKST